MKRVRSTAGSARKPSRRSPSKSNKPAGTGKVEKKNFLKEILGCGWLKKAMVGKSQAESLDLLDR